MKSIQFYFLKDRYFTDFPDKSLMRNKEASGGIQHGRPCFFSFPDPREPRILWMVPVSSKFQKYRAIAAKQQKKYGRCDTIVLGKLFKRDAVFLIQNMCPVTRNYLIPYVDKKGNPVTIDNVLANEIRSKGRLTVNLIEQKVKVTFPDVNFIYDALSKKLAEQDEEEKKKEEESQKDSDESQEENDPKQDGEEKTAEAEEKPESLDSQNKDEKEPINEHLEEEHLQNDEKESSDEIDGN